MKRHYFGGYRRPPTSVYSFILKMELSVSYETDLDLNKLHCVDCSVIGNWIEMSQVEEGVLKHFKCGLEQKTVPDAVLVFKNNQFSLFWSIFVFTNSYFFHLCLLRSNAFDICTG